jgi:hypothetical protein
VSRFLKVAVLAFSAMRMLPIIHGFRLGPVCTVRTMLSMHLLMKPVTEVVHYSVSLDESWNIFQSVLSKTVL